MLEIRPTCENCNKPLPNDSTEAMICSYECTYCRDCVENVLHNVCPNCGGGFEKRPTRPNDCKTGNCTDNHPVGEKVVFNPIDEDKFAELRAHFAHIAPEKR